MDTLDGTEWDVLISGTGLQQSLLALALSRSDKKVLHVDKNDFYGGPEAALSLQEAESWASGLAGQSHGEEFSDASITRSEGKGDGPSKLSFSRAYSLALAPQLIYADSKLLPSLVSSKTYKQLEFVAMGSWFVFSPEQEITSEDTPGQGTLQRIPTTREDLVFSDKSIDIRSKRVVMKVLRFVVDYEAQKEIWKSFEIRPFTELLVEHFRLPARLHGLFLALTLSLMPAERTTTAFALPRIARHLRSTGRLGIGFNAVIPKWGGLSEIAQVACRAGAVGGAVYVLGKGLSNYERSSDIETRVKVTLSGTDRIRTSFIVESGADLVESQKYVSGASDVNTVKVQRSISIVSSTLSTLFPTPAEGAPPPAGAVVVCPAGTLDGASYPVYLLIHSSDTGECPAGQCVIYATTTGPSSLLTKAVARLSNLVDESSIPTVLWCLQYQQHWPQSSQVNQDDHVISFPPAPMDLAFDDGILGTVKDAWVKVMGADAKDFLVFEDRNQEGGDDDVNDYV